ncbi:MAG: hypothetical protein ACRDGQ_08160 [Candidatus Limnocylindrales bacterium]
MPRETQPTTDQPYLRRAGGLVLADGSHLAWSCADGSRGRRWRAVLTSGSGPTPATILESLLLEVDLDGRPARLELATPAGMLTLHPSADGLELHGNIVPATGEGVEGLRLRWGPAHELDIAGLHLAIAVGLQRRRDGVVIGRTIQVDLVVVGPDLDVGPARRRIRRVGQGSWLVLGAPGLPDQVIELQTNGLPAGGVEEPLETD